MNLVVTGSRDWPEDDITMIGLVLDRLFWNTDEIEHCYVGYDPSKKQPGGVDRIVYKEMEWVTKRPNGNVRLHTFPADWDRYGKAAGPIRNADMLNAAQTLGGGLVVAFHSSLLVFNNPTSGTNHCARLAEQMGFTVYDIVRNPRPA